MLGDDAAAVRSNLRYPERKIDKVVKIILSEATEVRSSRIGRTLYEMSRDECAC